MQSHNGRVISHAAVRNGKRRQGRRAGDLVWQRLAIRSGGNLWQIAYEFARQQAARDVPQIKPVNRCACVYVCVQSTAPYRLYHQWWQVCISAMWQKETFALPLSDICGCVMQHICVARFYNFTFALQRFRHRLRIIFFYICNTQLVDNTVAHCGTVAQISLLFFNIFQNEEQNNNNNNNKQKNNININKR